MSAVFVAGKVEECIRRARDIVNAFHHLYCLIRSLPAGPIEYVGDTYYVWRDRLCTTEALLLRELGFHVQPASPVGLLLSYMKILEVSEYKTSEGQSFAQVALNYLNDALKTNAYILFQPRILAVTSISLAFDKLNLSSTLLPPTESLTAPWYTLFDVNETELTECKKIVMTIYNRELDVLLPLTKEELTIFATSIRPDSKEISEKNNAERIIQDRDSRDDRDTRDRSDIRDRREYGRRRDYSNDRHHGHRDNHHSHHSHQSTRSRHRD